MKNTLDISVIIATYNRAEILYKTLESFIALDKEELNVNFIIIDNNSSDNTKEVVDSFSEKLQIKYLYETKPGKNCALNKALDEINLGSLVVFTDDDVIPRKDWLKKIIEVSNKWPNYDVFGGRIDLLWPETEIPLWAKELSKQGWAFGCQHLTNGDMPYPHNRTPCGPNYWVRGNIFKSGRRFDEEIGPRPDNRLLCDESSFLFKLAFDGFPSLYSPSAIVKHRVHKHLLTEKGILKRAYGLSRGGARLYYTYNPNILNKNIIISYTFRLVCLIRWLILYLLSYCSLSLNKRILLKIKAVRGIGWNIEAIRFIKKAKNKKT